MKRDKRQRRKENKTRANPKHWSPMFAGVGDGEPLWRRFWAVMIVAAALRLLAAISGDWLIRTDELFQYLEQAHRIVFGYGQIPWEFRFGERTWLLPAMSVPPLWFAKVMGWTSPEIYAPLVRSFHALLSLTVPAGMYLFTRRINGEKAARVALVFGCFWHELVVVSPHPTVENTSANLVFIALMLTTRSPGIVARALIGALLALVVVLRVQYAPVSAFFGLLLLLRPTLAANIAMVTAGLAVVFAAGLLDYLTWGGWWQSYINYFAFQFSDIVNYTGKPDPAVHLKSMLIASAGLFYFAMLCALPYFRIFWVAAGGFLAVQIPHNIFPNEYTNIFVGVPFMLVICACLVAEWVSTPQKRAGKDGVVAPAQKAAWFSAALLAVSMLAYGGLLPQQTHMYVFKNPRPLFYGSEYFKVNKAFAKMPSQKVRSIVFLIPGGSAHLFGGYYYTHQNAPMWFPFTDDYSRDALGLREVEMKDTQTLFGEAGAHFANKASHLVMPRGAAAEGFSVVFETERMAVWENNNIAAVTIPPDAVYDIMENNIIAIINILDKRLGVVSAKDHPLTPFKRDASFHLSGGETHHH